MLAIYVIGVLLCWLGATVTLGWVHSDPKNYHDDPVPEVFIGAVVLPLLWPLVLTLIAGFLVICGPYLLTRWYNTRTTK